MSQLQSHLCSWCRCSPLNPTPVFLRRCSPLNPTPVFLCRDSPLNPTPVFLCRDSPLNPTPVFLCRCSPLNPTPTPHILASNWREKLRLSAADHTCTERSRDCVEVNPRSHALFALSQAPLQTHLRSIQRIQGLSPPPLPKQIHRSKDPPQYSENKFKQPSISGVLQRIQGRHHGSRGLHPPTPKKSRIPGACAPSPVTKQIHDSRGLRPPTS